ncbi:hypothetical protein F5Y01DRAFT_96604 [Xylaria sp. FL0043]|nr:hypothetical protein F5Y01DRAFT_96604 [Xylaria sp. FL0043]
MVICSRFSPSSLRRRTRPCRTRPSHQYYRHHISHTARTVNKPCASGWLCQQPLFVCAVPCLVVLYVWYIKYMNQRMHGGHDFNAAVSTLDSSSSTRQLVPIISSITRSPMRCIRSRPSEGSNRRPCWNVAKEEPRPKHVSEATVHLFPQFNPKGGEAKHTCTITNKSHERPTILFSARAARACNRPGSDLFACGSGWRTGWSDSLGAAVMSSPS